MEYEELIKIIKDTSLYRKYQSHYKDEESLFILAPPGAGKTTLAIYKFLKTIASGKKAAFIVPYKALANEIYNRIISLSDYNIFISTGDFRHYDEFIKKGFFNGLISIYEKFLSFIFEIPHFLDQFDFVILDEIQVISDYHRGANIDILLAILKEYRKKMWLMSAVIDPNSKIVKFLNVPVLSVFSHIDTCILKLTYKGLFDKNNNLIEKFPEENLSEIFENPVMKYALKYIYEELEKDNQILFFCSTKSESMDMAYKLYQYLRNTSFSPLREEIEEYENSLMLLPMTQSRQMLLNFAKYGIAFHNTNLVGEERELIEKYYKKGSIKIIFSTSTLAMGVNLPADVVFINKWEFTQGFMRNLSSGKFINMAGRGGRFNNKVKIYIYTKAYETPQLISFFPDEYEFIQSEDLISEERKIAVNKLLNKKFLFFHYVKKKDFSLDDVRFIENFAEIFAVTNVSKYVVFSIKDFVIPNLVDNYNEFLLLFFANILNNNPTYIYTEKNINYNSILNNFFPFNYSKYADKFYSYKDKYSKNMLYKTVLILSEWINDKPTCEIEHLYKVYAGALENIASDTAFYIGLIKKVLEKISKGKHEDLIEKLDNMQERTLWGVSEKLLPLTISKLRRDYLQKLHYEGFCTLDEILDMNKELWEKILPGLSYEKFRKSFIFYKKVSKKIQKMLYIFFTGNYKRKKYEVIIDDKSLFLPLRLYKVFFLLVKKSKNNPQGLTAGDLEVSPDRLTRTISELRNYLQTIFDEDVTEIVKNVDMKRYIFNVRDFYVKYNPSIEELF